MQSDDTNQIMDSQADLGLQSAYAWDIFFFIWHSQNLITAQDSR